MGDIYRLTTGKTVAMTGGTDDRLNIDGEYQLDTFRRIPAYATVISISKNPGIPIVWFGAILASCGPFLAFFVSRRRVWAFIDWDKKQIWVGGESRYSREDLEDEIAEVIESWSQSKEIKTTPPLHFKSTEDHQKLSQYL